MHEAKTHFSKLIARVEAGEEIVVQRGDVPVATIVPYRPAARARKAGALRGQIHIAADFDELPAEFDAYLP